MSIKVLIADDHRVVAQGLGHLIGLEEDMVVVDYVADGQAAVQHSLDRKPDVVLMDSAMPGLNGAEAARILRQRLPQTRVVMLSMYSDPVHVYRALQAGAIGYVVKKSAAEEVVHAIRLAHRGQRFISQPLLEGVIEQMLAKDTAEDPLGRLSARERQVLQLLAEGRSVAEIAASASLSPKTVETYRARLMSKLGIHELAGLVKFAIQHGITSLG
jgi:DNA-binding NarL/FixJ family response regulator